MSSINTEALLENVGSIGRALPDVIPTATIRAVQNSTLQLASTRALEATAVSIPCLPTPTVSIIK